jgi:hypothetical protein
LIKVIRNDKEYNNLARYKDCLWVGLKSNRSFRDFPYYGKRTKSKYCPTEKKIKTKNFVSFSGEQREGTLTERESTLTERERERERASLQKVFSWTFYGLLS